MRLNSDHRAWVLFSIAFTAVAAAGYVAYVNASPYGPSGGSWPGLAFGILGTLFMVLAGLLAARKKVRTWRIGSAQLWMKMHIWLGLLAVPCIWFHSGFAFGGALTTLLMILFYVVIASGIFGLVLQQFIPAAMTRRVPLETVRGQMDHVLAGLATDAYELVASMVGPVDEAGEEQERAAAEEPVLWKATARLKPAESPPPQAREVKAFYLSAVRPYLLGDRRRTPPPDFQAVMLSAPAEWHARLERLRALCEEARQLAVQARLHAWLHGWLFVHAPISFALFVLAAFHIVFALRY